MSSVQDNLAFEQLWTFLDGTLPYGCTTGQRLSSSAVLGLQEHISE